MMCNVLQAAPCGYGNSYVVAITIILLPVILQKKLTGISYFSMVVLFFAGISVWIIMFICLKLYKMPEAAIKVDYGLNITAKDRDYKYWNFQMIPYYLAGSMNIFEGQASILNFYAEADKPQTFFHIQRSVIVFNVFLQLVLGIVGYITFGSTLQSLIIYNLSSKDPLSIICKIFFIICIMGSFAL